jgi:preprotein translocase subunit SecA
MKKPFKAVTIEVLSEDNKRVLSRHRFVADEGNKKVRFTEAGVDQVINTFVAKFEMDNPGHQYRLTELAGAKFRLVWGDHAPVRKSGYIANAFTDAREQVPAG